MVPFLVKYFSSSVNSFLVLMEDNFSPGNPFIHNSHWLMSRNGKHKKLVFSQFDKLVDQR